MTQPTYWNRSYLLRGGVTLQLGKRTLIMGILNATPDSFSDGGKFNTVDSALKHTEEMVSEGVDIIDIGGESTRPGYIPVSVDEEISRVVPVIEAIQKEFPHIPISIDTYKADTAREALQAGAHIINDIWSLKFDPRMAEVAAKFDCPVILNHNRKQLPYHQLLPDVITDLMESINIAMAAGVSKNNIWLDPGIGFAKTYEENLDVHARLNEINKLGYPVLLGTSRKRFIREALHADSIHEVGAGTIASNVLGIAQGCQIVRVHDVASMKKAALMADAILYRLPQYKEKC